MCASMIEIICFFIAFVFSGKALLEGNIIAAILLLACAFFLLGLALEDKPVDGP